jgi:hypothetical protein
MPRFTIPAYIEQEDGSFVRNPVIDDFAALGMPLVDVIPDDLFDENGKIRVRPEDLR